jgi:hypothetical protein
MSDGVAAMAWTHSKRFDESDLIYPSVQEDEVAELPQDTAADLGEELVHADEISVDSTGSEDGQSDGRCLRYRSVLHSQASRSYLYARSTLRGRFRAYYLSKRFVLVSNVFGTLLAFFLVGQRIEGFLHSEGIVSSDFVAFDFTSEITFWALTAWLILFLATSALVFYSVQPFKGLESNRERSVVLAAGIDAVLTSVCLTTLLSAKFSCCDN